jgi:putative FmdB family regulatory protein
VPTYQYACTACDHRFDAVQSFSDASLTVCPVCSGVLRKVFSSVGIVFKGSGFYRTDSRAGVGATVAKSESKSESGGSSEGSSGGSSSEKGGSSSEKPSEKSSSGTASAGSSSGSSSSGGSSSTPAAAAS